jgi:hypothetical protein
MKQLDQVREFHEAFGLAFNVGFTPLRKKLIAEEFNELLEAWVGGNPQEYGKELADFMYVILGGFLETGKAVRPRRLIDTHRGYSLENLFAHVNWWLKGNNPSLFHIYEIADSLVEKMGFSPGVFQIIFDEVHRSNMSKLVDGKPVYREDGKVMKGPNYSPADLSFLSSPLA